MLQNHFSLSPELCKEIECAGTLRTYKKGHTLHQQGDRLNSVSFILSGMVCLWMDTPDNNQELLTILEPGTILGDMILIDNGVRNHTCMALEDCSVYSVPDKFMRHIARSNLEFSHFLNQTLALKLRKVIHSVYRTRFSSKTQRLADVLLELCEVSRSETLSITQAQLGQLVGCSRPTIISELKEFERRGLIRLRYGRIRIEDKKSLHTIADHHSCKLNDACSVRPDI